MCGLSRAQVCELFGLDEAGEDMSMRQYELTEPEEWDPDRLFQGEIGRLKTHLVGGGALSD